MIFLCDLDGTLLDISEKYHRLYVELLREAGFHALTKAEYWEARQYNVSNATILERTGAGRWLGEFQRRWFEQIETEPWLRIDQPFAGAVDALARMKDAGRIALVTLRRDAGMLLEQLEWTELLPFFDVVLTGPVAKDPWRIKVDIVRKNFDEEALRTSCFIGDMETDILAGRTLGAKTIAVASGLRSKHVLRELAPDLLLPSIASISSALGSILI